MSSVQHLQLIITGNRRPGSLVPVSELPVTTVIICFHNEAWSTLLRTVHSVINRSPYQLVHKILLGYNNLHYMNSNSVSLVDDASTFDNLKSALDNYMKKFDQVEILRLPVRIGLIRARLIGANHTETAVLTFLDSHCECMDGWLEPLLDRISRNPKTVVSPAIDAIREESLHINSNLLMELFISNLT